MKLQERGIPGWLFCVCVCVPLTHNLRDLAEFLSSLQVSETGRQVPSKVWGRANLVLKLTTLEPKSRKRRLIL